MGPTEIAWTPAETDLLAWRAGEFGFVYCREREPRKRAAESHQELASKSNIKTTKKATNTNEAKALHTEADKALPGSRTMSRQAARRPRELRPALGPMHSRQ